MRPDTPTDKHLQLILTQDDIRRILDITACTVSFSPLTFSAKTDCLSSELTITCTSYENVVVIGDNTANARTGKTTNMKENNIEGVFEAINNNIGVKGLNRIISTLVFDTFNQGKFSRHAKFLYKGMERQYPSLMKDAISAVFRHYESCGILPDSTTGILGITVSYDGTLMTRGHLSHIGVGFVVEVDVGFVVDREVISNFCQICSRQGKRKIQASAE